MINKSAFLKALVATLMATMSLLSAACGEISVGKTRVTDEEFAQVISQTAQAIEDTAVSFSVSITRAQTSDAAEDGEQQGQISTYMATYYQKLIRVESFTDKGTVFERKSIYFMDTENGQAQNTYREDSISGDTILFYAQSCCRCLTPCKPYTKIAILRTANMCLKRKTFPI